MRKDMIPIWINQIGEKVLAGTVLDWKDVVPLVQVSFTDLIDLAAIANRIREFKNTFRIRQAIFS